MVDYEELMQGMSSDEEKVVKELVDVSKNLITKTELTHEQIVGTCVLGHIADKYDMPPIRTFVERFLQGMISNKRMGRKEFIQALQAVRENKENMGFFGNLRGKLQ